MTRPRINKDIGIVPNPCTTEQNNRNWNKVRRLFGGQQSLLDELLPYEDDSYYTGGGTAYELLENALIQMPVLKFRLTSSLVKISDGGTGQATGVLQMWNRQENGPGENDGGWGDLPNDSADPVDVLYLPEYTLIDFFDFWEGQAGDEGWCRLLLPPHFPAPGQPVESGQAAAIIWMKSEDAFFSQAIEFTLTSNLSGGDAAATVTASWDAEVDAGAAVTVYDDQGRFTDSITGCKGVALRLDGRYRVWACQRAASRASASLSSPMCGDIPALNGDWAIEPHGDFVVDPGAGTLRNFQGHYGKSGDTVVFERIDKVPPFTWDVRDVSKHTISVMTSLAYDAENCKIVKTYLPQVAVELCSDTPQEDDVLTMTELTYITGASVVQEGTGESETCKLQLTRAKMCGFPVDEVVAPTEITMQRVDSLTDVYVSGTTITGIYWPTWVVCLAADPYEADIHEGTEC